MTTLQDKHNFDLGYEKGCHDTKEKWKQTLQSFPHKKKLIEFLKTCEPKTLTEVEKFAIEVSNWFDDLLKEVEDKP